ncbi:sulfate/molybdate ABC transporter ATP-binding protein [Merdimonas faecis]
MSIQAEIRKIYGDFKLDIKLNSHSKRIGILGASGCGKSMTLKSIAGIEQPDSGWICIEGKTVYDSAQKINWKPQKRKIGYLFQNYALFPTMTVEANIGAGVKGTKAEKKERTNEMIRKFRLEGLESRLPGQLSDGQQQRVALARIMAYRPEMILLDEPYSALDVYLRDRLQQEMQEMLEDYDGTVILVSHSRDEIYRFSQELLVMDQGTIIRSGSVKEIFADPKRVEAARISGCKNIVKIRRVDAHTIDIPDWCVSLVMKRTVSEDITHIGFRAHDFIPVWGERKENCIAAEVGSIAELPFERKYFIKGAAKGAEEICWFVQRELLGLLEEKGMPEFLEMPEEKILLLK